MAPVEYLRESEDRESPSGGGQVVERSGSVWCQRN